MVEPQRFPSLASIRAFEAAARLGGFAKAAQELGTTAASVSYHVRQLEAEIGVMLFLRQAHRVELTEAGAMVAQEATAAFAALRASFASAKDIDQSRIALTTLPTLAAAWLTPKLGRFCAEHPGLSVDLDLSVDAEDLSTGRFDAAIRNGHGSWPGLRAIRLFPAIFMPLCAPALKNAVLGFGDPDHRSDVPLLGRPDWWALWNQALGAAAPAPDRFGARLSAEHLDVAMAVAGHGIVIASPILFHDEIATGRLMPVHDLVAGDGRAFWFTYPITRQRTEKIGKLRDWLVGEAARSCDAAEELIRRAIIMEPPSGA